MSAKQVKSMSFEEAMAELETVVAQLESGEVALEDSIKLYERGAALKAHCEARLQAAEEKVLAITRTEGGAPAAAQAFVEPGAAPAAASAQAERPTSVSAGAERPTSAPARSDDDIPF